MPRFASFDDQDDRASELLERYHPYIHYLVRTKTSQQRLACIEAEDVFQESCLKFLKAAQARPIMNPKAYISTIVVSVLVDMQRRILPIPPLPLDEDGELFPGILLIQQAQEVQDPADMLVWEEYLTCLADYILALPPQQRHAMLCACKPILEEFPENFQPFRAALEKHNIEIEFIHWPVDQIERTRVQASLVYARRKLRQFRDQFYSDR